ncbi:MAG: N(4)-(beta-N-acetylglucosaminyl)-L-asparaginase [Thaumarchaeota archaeon]|nr:N(4)-(beta-N-acetylglucosaminyl)-L-asparaginase [Nitrososphaerota archaeon]
MKAIIATWPFGLKAVESGWRILKNGGSALDAVEASIREIENDFSNRSVGLGGYPNIAGFIELDAAIMDGSTFRAGSVAAVRNVQNPISLARKVMENTPHVMIVGEGATKLAKIFGLYVEKVDLQPEARMEWERRLKAALSAPQQEGSINFWMKMVAEGRYNHDTIGCVAIDDNKNIVAGCSTSGYAFKLVGRVGDSPIIGSGLYANSFGGAAATGLGENIMVHNVSRKVVDFIEHGLPADEAAEKTVQYLLKIGKRIDHISFVSLDKDGLFGAGTTEESFEFAAMSDVFSEPRLLKVEKGARLRL